MSRLLARRRNAKPHQSDATDSESESALSYSSGAESQDDLSETENGSESEEEEEVSAKGAEMAVEHAVKPRKTTGVKSITQSLENDDPVSTEVEEIEYTADAQEEKQNSTGSASRRESSSAKKLKEMEDYRRKLKEDPSFTPSVGQFWLHDDRFAGRGRGRGRGNFRQVLFFRGRGRGAYAGVQDRQAFNRLPGTPAPAAGPTNATPESTLRDVRPVGTVYSPDNDPADRKWVHDKFEDVTDNRPSRLRHMRSWAPKEHEVLRSTSFRVGEHAVTITKRTSTPNLRSKAPLAANEDGSVQPTPSSDLNTTFKLTEGVGGVKESELDTSAVEQVPRASKRYLGSTRGQGQHAMGVHKPNAPQITTAPPDRHDVKENVLKKAVDAPEFQPSNPVRISTEPLATQQNFMDRPPRGSHPSRGTFKKRYTKPQFVVPDTEEKYQDAVDSAVGGLSEDAPDPSTMAGPTILTNSGQMLFMTEDGLMIPATDTYGGSGYMFAPGYPNFTYGPVSPAPVDGFSAALSAGVIPPTFGYYPTGPQLYYPAAMYTPPATITSAMMPLYPNAAYAVSHVGVPQLPMTMASVPLPVEPKPSVTVTIRKPDEAPVATATAS
ncbi:hypothetical protein HDU85_005388 [Gaertneriomyces sp. JEL0708]|nr:hypothetical protein HDU85_005388 [Gaertneriomyces sp. JEL0708]